MKRSEMIKDIKQSMVKMRCMSLSGETADKVAEYILSGIEEAGMLPPNTMPDSLQLTERNTEFLAKVNRHFKWKDSDE